MYNIAFYFEQKQSVSPAVRQGISELREFPFISKIRGTQLMETTKFIPMVINEKWYTDKIISTH